MWEIKCNIFLARNPWRVSGLIIDVTDNELAYAYEDLIERNNKNKYHDYFCYVMNTLNLNQPGHWRDALELYENLTTIAVNGM